MTKERHTATASAWFWLEKGAGAMRTKHSKETIRELLEHLDEEFIKWDRDREAEELWVLYQDLIERSVKVATWYGHDLDAALGEHLQNAGVYPPFLAAHNTGRSQDEA